MLRFVIVLLLFPLALPAFAETAEDARKELSTTLSAIKESDKRQKELAQKTLQLQAELKRLEEEMVDLAGDATEQEEVLSTGEEKLSVLQQQKKLKTESLNARQQELSTLVSAMIKLRQMPPEAVIAMPGKLGEMLETARALSIVTHAVEDESRSLKAQLHELDTLEDKIRHGREILATHKMTLSEKQAQLAAKVKERTALVEKLGGQEREEKERVAKLTEKSQSLQELVDSLQKSEYGSAVHHPEQAAIIKRHEKAAGHNLRSFADARGKVLMPAAGKIVSHYGNPDIGQTFSKGIIIETREDTDVVAPYDGEVVFAGPFRDYGRMVIIRHADDYHTLLSGMEEIDCKPGQYLLKGEPVGSMGGSGDTHLYMELREDGRPVDPSDWIKG